MTCPHHAVINGFIDEVGTYLIYLIIWALIINVEHNIISKLVGLITANIVYPNKMLKYAEARVTE